MSWSDFFNSADDELIIGPGAFDPEDDQEDQAS